MENVKLVFKKNYTKKDSFSDVFELEIEEFC